MKLTKLCSSVVLRVGCRIVVACGILVGCGTGDPIDEARDASGVGGSMSPEAGEGDSPVTTNPPDRTGTPAGPSVPSPGAGGSSGTGGSFPDDPTSCVQSTTPSSPSPDVGGGELLERAEDDLGTCSVVTERGSVEVSSEQVRVGEMGFKHTVSPPLTGESKRAEVDCGGFGEFDPEKVYWYGFSLYMPSSQFPSDLGVQFLNQLRFSNITWNGYEVQNCFMFKECGGTEFFGGSGHELLAENDRLVFHMRHQEPGCGDCMALDEKLFDLGAVPKDVWVDFVYQGLWTGETDGFFNAWMQVDGAGYRPVIRYEGRTWVENHPPGSFSYSESMWRPRVSAPNFTVGLYYNDDDADRYMYSDSIRYVEEQPGKDGFQAVSVGGVPRPDGYGVCDDCNSATFFDYFTDGGKCVGTPAEMTCPPEHLYKLHPTDDALVSSDEPDVNFGDGDRMRVSLTSDGRERRGLFSFDLGQLPSDGRVLDAVLRLQPYNYSSDGPLSLLVDVTEPNPWDEASVTWDSQPASASTISKEPAVVHEQNIFLDITEAVQEHADAGTDLSLMLRTESAILAAPAYNQFLDVRSTEGNDDSRALPELQVCVQ